MEGRTLLSTITVSNANDSGAGSLRDAISHSAAGDTINFARGIHTITLTSGELAIAHDLTIIGPKSGGVTVTTSASNRIFDITQAGANVSISNLTVEGGTAPTGGDVLDNGGSLALTNDTIEQGMAAGTDPTIPATGGGVAVTGSGASLTVVNSTFSNDIAPARPAPMASRLGTGASARGAIFADAGTTLSVTGSTFAGDSAAGGDGGTGDGGGTSPQVAFGGPARAAGSIPRGRR